MKGLYFPDHYVGFSTLLMMTVGVKNIVFLERSEGTLSNYPRPPINKRHSERSVGICQEATSAMVNTPDCLLLWGILLARSFVGMGILLTEVLLINRQGKSTDGVYEAFLKLLDGFLAPHVVPLMVKICANH